MNGGEAAANESEFQWNALMYRYHGSSPAEDRPGTVSLPPDVGSLEGKDTGRRYLYRPGEVVVREVDLETYPNLARILEDVAVRQSSGSGDSTYGEGTSAVGQAADVADVVRAKRADRQKLADRASRELGVARFQVPSLAPDARNALHQFIEELRETGENEYNEKWPVHPHIVMAGESGSYGPAEPPDRVPDEPVIRVPDDLGAGIRVGVVDTGAWKLHEFLQPHCHTRGPEDDEVLDQDQNGCRDYEAGHGTFIAGIIHQYAPAAEIVCRGTVDSNGTIDDETLGATLLTLLGERIDILNLSLGGYTFASEPTGVPSTIAGLQALRAENPRLVVVAAAGNHNRAERFYPAGWPDVVGVGALERNFSKALFSNYGSWVMAWAPGVRLLSSFVGEDLKQPGGGSTRSWARWSGTSFATPVIAGKIAGAMKRFSDA